MFFSPCSVRRNERKDFFSPEDEKSRDVDDENGKFYSLYTDKSTKTDFVKVGEMSKKILSILFCIILACTAGTACSQLSENEKSASADSLSSSDNSTNAISGENCPLQKIRENDETDSYALTRVVDPYIPGSLKRVAVGEDGRITDPELSMRPGALIGEDNRFTVPDPSAYPFSAIAYMEVFAKCGCNWTGSGCMVGPKGLITAAHCLVCPKHHAGPARVDFYFGYQSDGSYLYKNEGDFYYWYGTDFSETNGEYTDESAEWDYGYVLFNERVGDVTGWFGMQVLTDSHMTDTCMTIAGYRDGYLKYHYGMPDIYTPNVISIKADAVAGNSGGPVFFNENGWPYVTSIYVAATDDNNYARRITPELFVDMKKDSITS